jgi:hypothetical protein
MCLLLYKKGGSDLVIAWRNIATQLAAGSEDESLPKPRVSCKIKRQTYNKYNRNLELIISILAKF